MTINFFVHMTAATTIFGEHLTEFKKKLAGLQQISRKLCLGYPAFLKPGLHISCNLSAVLGDWNYNNSTTPFHIAVIVVNLSSQIIGDKLQLYGNQALK